MVTVRTRIPAASVVFLVALAACSREQQDWRAAERVDTIRSYGQFIEHHPESELTTEAHTRIAQLGEDREWQQAVAADTADAYRQFIAQHPNGKWAQDARIRLEGFALHASAAPSTAASSTAASSAAASPAALPAASSAALPAASSAALPAASPAALPASAAPVPTPGAAAAAGYGIQLGAFTSEDKANAQWHALAGRFAGQLQGLTSYVVSADTGTGRIYRLQVAVGDESRARAICDALREQSQACVPVVPR